MRPSDRLAALLGVTAVGRCTRLTLDGMLLTAPLFSS
jgi:hypothetical protein